MCKKILVAGIWAQRGLNQAQKEVFSHLLVFGSYVFLEITYNDSLRQCLPSNRGKTHEKKIGTLANLGQTSQNWA